MMLRNLHLMWEFLGNRMITKEVMKYCFGSSVHSNLQFGINKDQSEKETEEILVVLAEGRYREKIWKKNSQQEP